MTEQVPDSEDKPEKFTTKPEAGRTPDGDTTRLRKIKSLLAKLPGRRALKSLANRNTAMPTADTLEAETALPEHPEVIGQERYTTPATYRTKADLLDTMRGLMEGNGGKTWGGFQLGPDKKFSIHFFFQEKEKLTMPSRL